MAQVPPAWFDSAQRADTSHDRLDDSKLATLIAQGKDDTTLPTINSFTMQQQMPGVRLKLYPDSGHGFLFLSVHEFSKDVNDFLHADIN